MTSQISKNYNYNAFTKELLLHYNYNHAHICPVSFKGLNDMSQKAETRDIELKLNMFPVIYPHNPNCFEYPRFLGFTNMQSVGIYTILSFE